MFKKNEEYRQHSMFGITNTLSAKKSKLLSKSIEHSFLLNVFSKIDEGNFTTLYSKKKSRPNTPVNQLVGALILKHLYDWTYEELFKNLNFNLLTRHAIGIDSLEEEVFSEATIYNFQNKLIDHFVSAGKDLLTEVFDKLTQKHLVEFGVKTDIQRGDSFLIGSNIFDFTRLQLLIEVLLRLTRILDESEKNKFSEILCDYTRRTSGQYIFKIEKADLPKEINKVAKIYHRLYSELKNKYSELSRFKIFERVYYEHFILKEDKIEVKSPKQLNSSVLLAPDDEEATYLNKGYLGKKGYSGHISETANPDNELSLITDCIVVQNNVDDAKILENRLPEMLVKTPDLSEYHADGLYGSPSVDEIMEESNIIQIHNTMRGRKTFAKMVISEEENGEYWVTCEHGQKVKAEKTTKGKNVKRRKAVFDYKMCLQCPLNDKCSSKIQGTKRNVAKRVWYFADEKIRLQKRMQNVNSIPQERRMLRANVEATVKELKRGIRNGKVRLRGQKRIMIYLSMTSLAVNLTRIHKYLNDKDLLPFILGAFLANQKCTIIQMRSFFQNQRILVNILRYN